MSCQQSRAECEKGGAVAHHSSACEKGHAMTHLVGACKKGDAVAHHSSACEKGGAKPAPGQCFGWTMSDRKGKRARLSPMLLAPPNPLGGGGPSSRISLPYIFNYNYNYV